MENIGNLKKGTGGSIDGNLYEIKMATLLFLRFKNCNYINTFCLATNLQGLNPLDDIVLCYTTITDPTVKTVFIQLKHVKRKLSVCMFTTRGKLNLLPYVKAFIRTKSLMSNEEKRLFRGSFEHCRFLIYTCTTQCKSFGKHKREDCTSEIDSLLKTGSEMDEVRKEQIFKFNKEEENDSEIISFLSDIDGNSSVGNEFLRVLRVFSGQAVQSELDDKIKEELHLAYPDKTASEMDFIFPFCVERFHLLWKDDSRQDLHENSEILDEVLAKCTVELLLLREENEFSLPLIFRRRCQFGNEALLHVITSPSSIKLSCTKLIQSLQNLVKSDYMFMSLDSLLKNTDAVMMAWSGKSKGTLVIVSQSTSEHEDLCNALFEHLQRFNGKRRTKKLIIVGVENDPFGKNLKQRLLEVHMATSDMQDVFQLAHLKREFKTKVLDRNVIFQGISTTLSELLEYEASIFDDDFISKIFTSGSLTIGSPLEEDVPYYISRTLERCDVLSKAVLKNVGNEVFIVHGISKRKLQALVDPKEKVCHVGKYDSNKSRFLVTESDNTSDIDKVFDLHENVHELRVCSDGCLRWARTKGSINLINEFILPDCPSSHNPTTALDLNGRVIVLIAEPGMGKTTLVTHLTSKTKTSNHSFWIVRIPMRHHKEELNRLCRDAEVFLLSALHFSQSITEKALLISALMKTGKCVVMLDGFDEITPEYTEQGLSLVRSLLDTKATKIYVTSRHPMKNILELQLSTVAFTLRKFDDVDLKRFFLKFWSKEQQTTLSDRVLKLIDRLIHLIAKSLNDTDNDFMGVPLQAMMLAEIYENYYENSGTEDELPAQLNICNMFEQVIDKKVNIYIGKIFPCDKNDYSKMKAMLYEPYITKHISASLVSLFSQVKIEMLSNWSTILEESKLLCEEIVKCDCKTGIIIEVLNGKPIFLHRTFAEFFAALWFTQNYHENRDFLGDNLFTDEFNVIRSQFDLMLAKKSNVLTGEESRLFTAAVNNDVQVIKSLLEDRSKDTVTKESGWLVSLKDKGGRSLLHLAATSDTGFHFQNPHYRLIGPPPQSTVQLLLELGADCSAEDEVLLWNPLQYALKVESWEILELLLGQNPVSDNVTLLKGNITNKEVLVGEKQGNKMKTTLMHAASACCYVNIVSVLGEVSLENIWAFDKKHRTPLHVACRWDNAQVAWALINRLQDDADARGTPDEESFGASGLDYPQVSGPESVDTSGLDSLYLTTPTSSDTTERDSDDISGLIFLLKECDLDSGSCDIPETPPMSMIKYINLIDRDNASALHLASRYGSKELVELLISKGGDIWASGMEEGTPLHSACVGGNKPAVRALIHSLGDNPAAIAEYIDNTCDGGRSALHIATAHDSLEIVTFLILKGANIRKGDHTCNTPLHYACRRGNVNITRALIGSLGEDAESIANYINSPNDMEYEWNVESLSAIQMASRNGYSTLVRYLVVKGGNVWADGEEGGTLLHDACKWGDVDTARTLIESLDEYDNVEHYVNFKDSYGKRAKEIALDDSHSDSYVHRLVYDKREVADLLDKVLIGSYSESSDSS